MGLTAIKDEIFFYKRLIWHLNFWNLCKECKILSTTKRPIASDTWYSASDFRRCTRSGLETTLAKAMHQYKFFVIRASVPERASCIKLKKVNWFIWKKTEVLSSSSSDSATKNPTSFRDAPECSACSKAAPLGLNETEAAALTALHHPQASPVSLAPSLLSASHRKCGNDSRKKG